MASHVASATHPSSIEAVSKSRNLVFSECWFPLQSVVNDFHGYRPPSLLDWFSNCYINWFFCPPLLSYPGEPCLEALVVCCSERPVCFLCLVSLQTQPVCPTSREWMYANRMDTLSLNSSLPLTKQRTVCEPREFFWGQNQNSEPLSSRSHGSHKRRRSKSAASVGREVRPVRLS